MTPYSLLTENDRCTLLNYINYMGNGSLDEETLPSFLSSWNEAKEPLLPLFNNSLRLERSISYDTPKAAIIKGIEEIIDKNRRTFIRSMHDTIYDFLSSREDKTSFDNKYAYLFQAKILAENEFPHLDWDPKPFDVRTPLGNRIRIAAGAKPMRLIGKLAHAFGYENEYEHFRIEVSQALNVAHLEGTLCLSIHPMDYITMSDNNCDWHSCMSWSNNGEYKLGTLEMLGSDYCVVAYLQANTPYQFNFYDNENNEWYNKKWRQLLFIHPSFICGNRQYPYEAPNIESIALSWLRSLAQNANFSYYDQELVRLTNHNYNTYKNNRFYLALNMNQMYNDLHKNNYYLATNFNEKNNFSINLSGEAHCVTCGGPIDSTPDPMYLQCEDCLEGFYCDCCGSFIFGTPEYTNSSDRQFCEYCMEQEDLSYCDICEEPNLSEETIDVDIISPDEFAVAGLCACRYCISYKSLETLFGSPLSPTSYDALQVTEAGHNLLNELGRDFKMEDLLLD